MRFRFGYLVVLFAAWAFVPAMAQQNEQPVYTISVGTFMDATAADFEGVQNLGFLYALPMGNNMFRVYMGGFTAKPEAEKAIGVLKGRGYQDAAVLELDPGKGKQSPIIQLGTRVLGQPFSWDTYKAVGPLSVILQDKSIKITSRIYKDMDAAKAALEEIREKGFKDAFIKIVNTAFVHDINAFYPEAAYTPPPSQPAKPAPVIEEPAEAAPAEVPQSYNQRGAVPVEKEVPQPYNQPLVNVPKPLPAANTNLVPKPSIRANAKRSSVTELQKLLKDGGYYTSSVDGLYGKGTAGAYEAAVKDNQQINKYNLLAGQLTSRSSTAQAGSLQFAIDILADNPAAALPILEDSRQPVAKAYQAYYHFAAEGPGQKINDLMNSAILEAYAKAVRPPATRFDYTSTYAYNNTSQLIYHLVYVQVVASPSIQTPCWLLQRHPEEIVRAFDPDPALPKANYALPDCGGFLEWPEVRTLISIARDLNGKQLPDDQVLAEGRIQTLGFILQPKALPYEDEQMANGWHNKAIAALTGWASRDMMLSDIAVAYKLLYFQSYVLLEDFYMNKGLKAAEAKGLAQATLMALVGPYMTRFI